VVSHASHIRHSREISAACTQCKRRQGSFTSCRTNIDGNRMMRNRHLRGYRQLRMNNFDEKVADAIARRLWSYRHGVARIAKGPKLNMTMQLSIIEKFFFSIIQYNEPTHSLIWYYKHCPRTFPLLYCGKTINLFSQYAIYVFSVLFSDAMLREFQRVIQAICVISR